MSWHPPSLRQPWQGYRSVRSTVSSSLQRLDPGAELLGLRAREREQLVDLNDRFAAYAETVRGLERRNRGLREQLEALRQKQRDPSRLQLLFRQELRSLRGLLEAEAAEKRRLEAGREQLRGARGRLQGRCEEAARLRLRAEETLRGLREEAGRAALANRAAEGSLGSLLAEIAFLRKLLGAESAELAARLGAARLRADAGPASAQRPDLAAALREIRAQYEALAGRNMQAAEDWYRARFASAAELAGRNQAAVRAMREETAEYRRLLQSRSAEVEALRGLVEALHGQLESAEDRQSGEVAACQGRVAELELEISEAKQEMARHLHQYQDLLNVKMALDVEIAAYRKLLEGEEIRLSYSAPL